MAFCLVRPQINQEIIFQPSTPQHPQKTKTKKLITSALISTSSSSPQQIIDLSPSADPSADSITTNNASNLHAFDISDLWVRQINNNKIQFKGKTCQEIIHNYVSVYLYNIPWKQININTQSSYMHEKTRQNLSNTSSGSFDPKNFISTRKKPS